MTCPRCGDKDRSTPQHRRFFKLVSVAYEHWPETYNKFRPENSEHLRAYLLCKAGWRTEVSFEMKNRQAINIAALAVKSLMRQMGNYTWVAMKGEALVVYAPKSISYKEAKHREICRVFTDAEDIICDIIGVRNGDELLKEAEKAA